MERYNRKVETFRGDIRLFRRGISEGINGTAIRCGTRLFKGETLLFLKVRHTRARLNGLIVTAFAVG